MKPLWKPSIKRKENSLLKDFCNFTKISHKDFNDVWKWSVKNPELFWSKFWDYSKIIGNKGEEIIRVNKTFNKTKIFSKLKNKLC